jgi:hypothetical protein
MTDTRPRHQADQSQHRASSSGQSNEQRRVDDIVRHVSEAFSSELSSIMNCGRRR